MAVSLFCGGSMALLDKALPVVSLLVYFLFITPKVLALETPNDSHQGIVFELKPHICVGSVNEACEAGIEFYWRLPHPQRICITHLSETLFCSEEAEGSEFKAMTIEPQCIFRLVSPSQRFAPLERQIKVLYIGQDVRLRRKHPWSIFE